MTPQNDTGKFDADQITAELKRLGLEIDVRCHETLASTQDTTHQAISDGLNRPLVIIAQHQTGGRGRRGRRWIHTAGGLAFTIAIQLPLDAAAAWPTIAASTATVLATEAHTGVALGIKWPNDLVHGTRKVGGVLTESKGTWRLVGVGLNTDTAPGTADGTPTVAIAELARNPIDRTRFIIDILHTITRALLAKPAERREFHQTWVDSSVVLGQRVVINGPDGHLYGHVESLPLDGTLHLRVGDGSRHIVHGGDLSLRLDPHQ